MSECFIYRKRKVIHDLHSLPKSGIFPLWKISSNPILTFCRKTWPRSCSIQILLGPNPARIPSLAQILLTFLARQLGPWQIFNKTHRFIINIYRVGIEMSMLRSSISWTVQVSIPAISFAIIALLSEYFSLTYW